MPGGSATFMAPSDAAFDAFFAQVDSATAQASARLQRLWCRCWLLPAASWPCMPASNPHRPPPWACPLQALLQAQKALAALAAYHVVPETIRFVRKGGAVWRHTWGSAAAGVQRMAAAGPTASWHVPAALLRRTAEMSEGQQLPTLAKDAQVGGAGGACCAGLRPCALRGSGMAEAQPWRWTGMHGPPRPAPPRLPQGNTLSLTVRRGGADGGSLSFEGVGSTARLLVPDVPICEASAAWAPCIQLLRLAAACAACKAPTNCHPTPVSNCRGWFKSLIASCCRCE